jgi:hypothetical protein
MATTYEDGREALVALQGHIQNELDTTYAATFAEYGGADVTLEDDESQGEDLAGKPVIVMGIESEGPSEAVRTIDAWDATARFDVLANPFNGATTGAHNPIGSDTKLSRTLKRILRTDYQDLVALGLYRIRIETSAETVDEPTEDDPSEVHTNPHRIRFTYFTP